MIKNSIFSTLIFAASNVFLCGSSMANDVILTSDSLSYCMNIGSISEPNYECGLSKKDIESSDLPLSNFVIHDGYNCQASFGYKDNIKSDENRYIIQSNCTILVSQIKVPLV